MTSRRLYCADIIKCNDFLYEDDDTLIAYATENPEEFIGRNYEDIVSVDTEDGLRITYTKVDDYDENDNEVIVTETETFEIEYTQMMVTVPELPNIFRVA